MRGKLLLGLVAMLSWTVEACCAALHEANSPEAVYYANAYADHYRIPRELVTQVSTKTLEASANRRISRPFRVTISF